MPDAFPVDRCPKSKAKQSKAKQGMNASGFQEEFGHDTARVDALGIFVEFVDLAQMRMFEETICRDRIDGFP